VHTAETCFDVKNLELLVSSASNIRSTGTAFCNKFTFADKSTFDLLYMRLFHKHNQTGTKNEGEARHSYSGQEVESGYALGDGEDLDCQVVAMLFDCVWTSARNHVHRMEMLPLATLPHPANCFCKGNTFLQFDPQDVARLVSVQISNLQISLHFIECW